MSSCESCKDRQENEIEVLKSIFGDELRDQRRGKNKKKWQHLDILVTLNPQKGMSGPAEVYAQIDLHVKCGEKYPDEVPTIELRNSRGLSHQQVATLYSELVELSKQLKGEVMIFELAQHVQKYLHEHNKPTYSSFYEEMVSRRKEKIECEMLERQMKEDHERQVLQDEIQRRQQALKAELRTRKDSTRIDPGAQSMPPSPHTRTFARRRCTSTSESSEGSYCEHRGTKILQFESNRGERQVHRGKCMGHSAKGSVVYAGVDMLTGELFAITEWTLKTTEDGLQHVIKQIGSLEQEVNHLHKLHHPNLVHYVNMKYSQDGNVLVIYVLQEFVIGTTCSFFLLENIPMDIDILRYLARGILSALSYLHENNVVHKDLRDSSIYIDRTGTVRLSDYSLDKRLADIYQSISIVKPEQDFPTIQGRGGKKADIFRFGVLLLSLLKGTIVSEDDIDTSVIGQPDLRDFLSRCLVPDERERWSAGRLLRHAFISAPLARTYAHALSPPRPSECKMSDNGEPEPQDMRQYVPSTGQSRIRSEFEILEWLGRGAFGDVLKVKNKLDGGIYAIKRIKLNPKNKLLNKKITREVKLLSRMNHENVVRYYNSWIESAMLAEREDQSTRTNTEKSISEIVSHLGSEDVEQLAPPLQDVEWNVSYKSRASAPLSEDSEEENSDDDSDSDEDCAFLMGTLLKIDSSESIEFEHDSKDQNSPSTSNQIENGEDQSNTEETVREIQFMYIQMEFCEKSTLRTAIDAGLYEDKERVWRLFREIIEGLAHIHQQGMIHRDLKPVNIFLDSNDHVKIGDFGLATTNILSSLVQTVDADKDSQVLEKGVSFGTEELGSLTGQVGTALYVAPELSTKAAKAIYNQKVDIYSLGVIFFEMCYRPLSTGMERVKVLLNLRSKEIVIPPEIDKTEMASQVYILHWLLNHDPSQRPTAQELLSSHYLPPPQLEETELQEIVRRTLSNPQSKAYKYLISCCFAQEVTAAEDITFDMNLPVKCLSQLNNWRRLQERVKDKVVEVFRRHGGTCMPTPLLMPRTGQTCCFLDSVHLMTRTGSVVCLPHDLRAPFARYVVWNNVGHVRRYAVERVYREKKARGFHPRELYECAFDIISPTPNNFLMESELISIVSEIVNDLPQLQERNFSIRLNHTSLLEAVLTYCGVEKDKYVDVCAILRDAREGKFSKFQVQTHLISLCLTDQAMETLFNLFETESSAKIHSVLKTITKRRGEAAAMAKEGLQEIELVMENVVAMGVKWPMVVVPLLVHNVPQHSGVIYQITCELKHRRRKTEDVIAAGGRYDKMLSSFRKILERTGMAGKETKQYGAGISISLEKLVSAVSETEAECNGVDVAVCCTGNPRREKEMIDVLKDLWNLGLKVSILDFVPLEEILEYCQENRINQVIQLKAGEKGNVRIQSWERDRFQERKIASQEIPDFFSKSDNSLPVLSRSESKTDGTFSNNNPMNININFVLSERDKLSGSARRSLKNSMVAQMSSYFQRIAHKIPIEIFAVFLETSVVKTIGSFLEIDEEEQDFLKSIQIIIDKHPRHKKYVQQICEEMRESRNEKLRPVLILYSLVDNRYITLV